MRIRPTHYSITAPSIKSWIVEGSLDGGSWTTIDRQTDNQDFKDRVKSGPWKTASFAVARPAEFHLIRLTQHSSDRSGKGNNQLILMAIEFFGTLYE
jgi:hypothetical protein